MCAAGEEEREGERRGCVLGPSSFRCTAEPEDKSKKTNLAKLHRKP